MEEYESDWEYDSIVAPDETEFDEFIEICSGCGVGFVMKGDTQLCYSCQKK